MTEIARLRGLVDDLDKYDLPDQFRRRSSSGANGRRLDSPDGGGGGPPGPAVPPSLLSRYKRARESYVRRQTMQRLVECLAGYDPASNSLPLPARADEKSLAEAKRRREEVLEKVRTTVEAAESGADAVRVKFDQFSAKRDELRAIVDGMERAQRQRALGEDGAEGGGDGGDESDGEEVTEEDLAHEKERLAELRRRKAELREKIRSVKSKIADASDDVATRKRAVDEIRAGSGRGPLDWSGLGREDGEGGGAKDGDGPDESNADGALDAVAEAVRSEARELSDRAAELRRSAEFYDGMRELMEELGGVKILSSRATGEDDDDGFVLNLMLLGQHILEIRLAKKPPPSGSEKGGDGDGRRRDLHVEGARLTTGTTFTMPSPPASDGDGEATAQLAETMHSVSLTNQSLAKIMAQRPSVSITIPPLDDLVAWSRTLDDSSRGIRFVLVETLGRIRSLDARVAELNLLRVRYAAQVYDIDAGADGRPNEFGGAEQEVVCAVNEGITVALRLGADCPLMPGSVYISEMYGVGGWSDERLGVLREAVQERRCRGPVEVMEVLVSEIRRRSKEEGWTVPSTPMLPRGRG